MRDNSLKAIKDLAAEIIQFSQTCGIEFDEQTEDLAAELEQMVSSECFNVMVLGMFSRGKSTFLNALIGKHLLFEDPNEATGAITLIRNSNARRIFVQSGGRTSEYDVDDKCYEKVKSIVSVENPESSNTQLLIDYPMNGFDEDITFMDTPGLNGLGKEQLMVTRKAMSSADAVIMVVSYTSLQMAELELVLGKNEAFGKIRPQNLIIVMNKIGIMLDNVPPEQEEEKINRSKNEILRQLKENGADKLFKDIQIYAVDSLYYLAAVDDDTYNSLSHTDITVSREEMRRISRFDKLRSGLMRFLESSNRAEQTRQKMTDVMSMLCESMNEYINGLIQSEEAGRRKQYQELTRKLESIYRLKRKVLAQISVYIREQINSLIDDLRIYKEKKYTSIANKCEVYIHDSIHSMMDIENSGYQVVTRYAEQLTADFSDELLQEMKNFYNAFQSELSVHTEQSLKKEFGYNVVCNTKLNVEQITVKKSSLSQSDFSGEEQKINQDMERMRRELTESEKRAASYHAKYKSEESRLSIKEDNIESGYRAALSAIGSRPAPREVMTDNYVEERVFLWFTKKVNHPIKSLDYSNVRAYDERRRIIVNNYSQQMDELKKEKRVLSEIGCNIDCEKRKSSMIRSELASLEEQRLLAERIRRDKENRERTKILDRSKQEMTLKIQNAVKNTMDSILNSAIVENDNIREKLVAKADAFVEESAKEFRRKTEQKLKEIQNKSYCDYDEVSKNVKSLLNKLNQEEN